MRDAALLKCAGNLLDPFGPGPADLAEDDLAFAPRAKDDTAAGELERDIDRAGQHRSEEPTTEAIASTLSTPF